MKRLEITPEIIVEEVFKHWPGTIQVFLRYQMGCVGCTMASFEPLSSAIEIYGLDPQEFIGELSLAARGD